MIYIYQNINNILISANGMVLRHLIELTIQRIQATTHYTVISEKPFLHHVKSNRN